MPDVINNHATWLARWIQRSSPDWTMTKAALAQVETKVRTNP